MVDANVLSEKLKQLSFRLAKIRDHSPAGSDSLPVGSDSLDVVSFNLLLAVQICLDLATHLIGDTNWAPAATAREAFERLEEHGVVSADTVRALRKAVGLRNLVAHGYESVDPVQIHAAATTGLADLERFAAELSAWVERQTGAGEI
jgi:uncharacterized protein YutE (UPF0331/DUF86 family)